MQIIAIRHAPTPMNEKELINGSIDEGLSEKGRRQIPDIIKSLEAYTLSAVWTSPMKRAVQTARPIAEHYKLPMHIDERLAEVALGSFEGQPWDATVPIFGKNSSGVLSTCEYDFTPYGGENAATTKARMQSFLHELKASGQSRPLIVCHGGVLRWFYFLCTGHKVGRIPNSSVHIFEL